MYCLPIFPVSFPAKTPRTLSLLNSTHPHFPAAAWTRQSENLMLRQTHYTFLTAPSPSPNSINALTDAEASATASLPLIKETITSFSQNPTSTSPHDPTVREGPAKDANNAMTGMGGPERIDRKGPIDAILIACYSPHPLVPQLLSLYPEIPCIDIFAASIHLSLQLLSFFPSFPSQPENGGRRMRFGIVSTGPQWREILGSAIESREVDGWERFGGVECVGLSAGELHPADSPPPNQAEEKRGGEGTDGGKDGEKAGGEVEQAVRAATRRLLARGDIGVVVLGCAGMVGMEGWVRGEVGVWEKGRLGKEEGGREEQRGGWDEGKRGEGGRMKVVDGVKAGVGVLQGIVRGGF